MLQCEHQGFKHASQQRPLIASSRTLTCAILRPTPPPLARTCRRRPTLPSKREGPGRAWRLHRWPHRGAGTGCRALGSGPEGGLGSRKRRERAAEGAVEGRARLGGTRGGGPAAFAQPALQSSGRPNPRPELGDSDRDTGPGTIPRGPVSGAAPACSLGSSSESQRLQATSRRRLQGNEVLRPERTRTTLGESC